MSKNEATGLEVRWWHKLLATVALILMLLPVAYRMGVVAPLFSDGYFVSPFTGIWLAGLIDHETGWFLALDWGISFVILILMSTHSYLRRKVLWARWTALAGYSMWALNSVVHIAVFGVLQSTNLLIVVVVLECAAVVGASAFIVPMLSPGFGQWLRTPDEPEVPQPVRGRVVVEDLTVTEVGDVDRPAGEFSVRAADAVVNSPGRSR